LMLRTMEDAVAARVRTTVSLPADLLRSMDVAVRRGRACSRSELLADAARRELARYDREEIDVQFAEMATDPAYRREALRIAEEVDAASWEALRMVEGEP